MPEEDVPFVIRDWRDAELFAAVHMRTLGFTDAEATQSSGDGGIDVVSRAALAQVKHFFAVPVGAPTVQQLVGAALRARCRLFYSLSGYTRAARALAEEANVALFEYTLDGEVHAASTAAKELEANGFAMFDPDIETVARDDFMRHLQRWGQIVVDVASGVVDQSVPIIHGWATDLQSGDEERAESARMRYAEAKNELAVVIASLQTIGGSREHLLVEFVKEFATLESIVFQLARRLGMNYVDLERASIETRGR
jgi:hypothetical protein